MVRRQGQPPSFHNGLAKIAPWPYLVGNASGLQCIGQCVYGGSPANLRLRASQRISAARDCIASPKSHSEPVNACNARSSFPEKVSALLNRSFGCDAISRSTEWNMFTVGLASVAILRITRLRRRNQPLDPMSSVLCHVDTLLWPNAPPPRRGFA